MRRLAVPYEVIYVDDGSTDGTDRTIARLREEDSAVKGILLSRSFGYQAALCAGLTAAAGRAVITMGANLHEPPEVIPELLSKWQSGYHIVLARPGVGPGNWLVRAAHRLLSRLQDQLGQMNIPFDTCNFALMDRQVIEQLIELPERNRQMRSLRAWVGFDQTTIEYDRHAWPVVAASSSLSSLVRGAAKAIFTLSHIPLKALTLAGCVLVGLVMCGGVLGSVGIFQNTGRFGGMAWLGLALALLGGLHLICLGILGEYLSRIYQETRHRPLFVVRKQLGFNRQPRLVPNVLDWLSSLPTTARDQRANRLNRHSDEPTLT